MSSRERAGLTRRAVLAGAAGAGAASLIEPAAGLADALGGPRAVYSRWLGTLAGQSPPLYISRRFGLVGVEWRAPRSVRIELRARATGRAWGSWVTASSLGHDPDGPARSPRQFGEGIWTGPADYVQLRASRPVDGVRLHFVVARGRGQALAAQAPALAHPILDAGPGQPPIIARKGWAQGQASPKGAAEYGAIKLAFVHHTQTPNGYAAEDVPSILLSIFDYHVYTRGFADIAYNFLIDVYGRIWEGRAGGIDEPVVGAQAGGYNAESTGVAVIGSFFDVVPPRAAISALERWLAWKLSLHGIPTSGEVTVVVDPADYFYTPFGPGAHVSLPRIAGHRQGDSTDCPGNAFFARLASIRPVAQALAGKPAHLTLAAPSKPVPAGTAVALSGRLTELLSGAPLAGEPIELQRLTAAGETTEAQLRTGADGSWRISLSLSYNALVRALHRPAPAVVSGVAAINVAPVVTLTVDSQSPLRVSGTVSPPTRHVTIDVYRLGHGHRRLLASKNVAATAGRFSTGITVRRHGRYLVRALVAETPRNAAGAAPAVEVTV